MVLKYIYHFDELSWMPEVMNRPFNMMNVALEKRHLFVDWLNKHATGQVYIWSGSVTPAPNQASWGHVLAPDGKLCFIIFENDNDQIRFALEFVGNPVGMSATTFKNGMDAYHYRKR